jgi:hypothetical protein
VEQRLWVLFIVIPYLIYLLVTLYYLAAEMYKGRNKKKLCTICKCEWDYRNTYPNKDFSKRFPVCIDCFCILDYKDAWKIIDLKT